MQTTSERRKNSSIGEVLFRGQISMDAIFAFGGKRNIRCRSHSNTLHEFCGAEWATWIAGFVYVSLRVGRIWKISVAATPWNYCNYSTWPEYFTLVSLARHNFPQNASIRGVLNIKMDEMLCFCVPRCNITASYNHAFLKKWDLSLHRKRWRKLFKRVKKEVILPLITYHK